MNPDEEEPRIYSLDSLCSSVQQQIESSDQRTNMACLTENRDVNRLIDLVQRQCLITPQSIALKTTAHSFSYKELWGEINGMENILSTILPTYAEGKETIAIHFPNSIGYIVSLLSIIGCGRAFLPLPVDMPSERMLFSLNDANVHKVIMTEPSDDLSSTAKVLLKHSVAGEDIVMIEFKKGDTEIQKSNQIQTVNESGHIIKCPTNKDISYIIYTSGSTGKPKGVQVKESSIINVARAQIKAWDIGPNDVIAQFASIGFDASIVEIFTSVLSGAALAILGEQERLGDNFVKAINAMNVTTITLPPSALSVYSPDNFQTLQKIISAGEVCSSNIAMKWASKENVRFFNAYGPTEGTVCATYYEYMLYTKSAKLIEDLPIGKAIDGVQVYLFVESMKSVPPGVVGEIYIGGKGVAHGYIGHAYHCTADRFVQNPFVDDPSKLFKTGDYAVEDGDGNLTFMGRVDDQIKIRGHRMDLKEIEQAIVEQPNIDMAVVVVHKCTEMNGNFLAAFIVSASIDISKLRNDLLKVLPKYMVPTFFKRLEASAFPKILNGKIDRKYLEKDESIHEQSRSCSSNCLNEEELVVAKHWATIFKFDESVMCYLNKETSFRELGGNSLQLVRLQKLIEDDVNQTVPFTKIAMADTLADLAGLIRRYKDSGTWLKHKDAQHIKRNEGHYRLIIDDSQLSNSVFATTEDCYSQSNDKCSALHVPSSDSNKLQLRNVLLSGVTGFLGTFILSELLTQTDVHVFCMVRATSKVKALGRIIDSMKNNKLWKSEYVLRMTAIVSDLTQQRFGISKDSYNSLESTVDVVFMNGAEVNMNKSYEELRSVNVKSMKEAIKFASTGMRKYLFATSSLSVFLFPPHESANSKPSRRLCTEVEFPDDPSLINGGYGQSKWASERLVMQALDFLPGGAIFRPARVTGRSTDGAGPKNDLFASMLLGMPRLGYYPDMDFPFDMVPVDFCAKSMVEILVKICSFPEEKIAKVYHIYNRDTIPFNQLFKDTDLQPCPLSEWRVKLQSADDINQELIPLTPFFMSEFWDNTRFWPVFDTSNTDNTISENTKRLMKPANELLEIYKRFFRL